MSNRVDLAVEVMKKPVGEPDLDRIIAKAQIAKLKQGRDSVLARRQLR